MKLIRKENDKSLSVRVTADVISKENDWISCPFVLTHIPNELNKPFVLSVAAIDYSFSQPLMQGHKIDSIFDKLKLHGFKNISILYKDKEHLDIWKPILEKHSDKKVKGPDSKDVEEVEEGLEYLRNELGLN